MSEVRSATETVMSALESFGEAEPKFLVIAWLDENDEVCVAQSNLTSSIQTLGLLEAAKFITCGYMTRSIGER